MNSRVRRKGKQKAIVALTAGALVMFHGAARADDTSDEIRVLKAQLKKLEEKVDEQARKQKETQVQIRSVQAHPAATPASYPPGTGVGPLGGAPQTGLTAAESAIRGLPVAGAPSLFINGVSITPGGFLALEGVFRNHFLPADIGSVYQSIPYYNSRVGYADEFRLSARQSRFSLLAKGDVDPVTHLAGYIEGDFLGAAQTANSNESNSYQPRIRHVYATFDQDDWGAHVLAGQNWSLITMNTKGIIPRQEDVPLTIDAQYVPGFAWARQPQLRFVKDFGKSFWAGISVENPQTTAGCAPASGVFLNPCFPAGTPQYAGYFPTVGTAATYGASPLYNSAAIGGSLFNTANSYSFNHVPDVAGKVAWDSSFDGHDIHVEGFGLFREFTDQTVNNPYFSGTVTNNNVAGGSGGGSILVSVLPKMLEVQFSGMTGRGVGRYGSGQLPDVAINWNGTLSPIQETMLLAGVIVHPTPQLDLYAYAGQEDQQASEATIITAPGHFAAYGYGNPLYTNAGCSIISSAACVGNTHLIRQITGGLWDNLYSGPFGKVRVGLQYSFTQRFSFAGVGGVAKTEQSAGMFSIRYYPFDAPPPAPVVAKY